MEPDYLDDLKAVLCDPEGAVCIHGSEMDRYIIQRCLAGLENKLQRLQIELITLRNLVQTQGVAEGNRIQDLINATKEVIRISDRDHIAWNKLKSAIAALENKNE